MTLEQVVGRFDGFPNGTGYKARCPIHEDNKPSLSISQKNDKILINCFAGCDTEKILAARNLTMRDLYIDSNAVSAVVATYIYCDRTGHARYRKLRTANKGFRFEKSDGKGGWVKGQKQNGGKPVMAGIERLPYRLNELVGPLVFVCEGEKDCDRLFVNGIPATTNDAGASTDLQRPKWTGGLTKHLRDAGITMVNCIPDNDAPGRAHMDAVARSCIAAGIEVRVINLPDLPDKGDVSDWLDAGHTIKELIDLCDATPPYVSPVTAPSDEPETVAQAIERLNQRFGIITVSNKVVVMENNPDGSIANLWPFEEFKRLLIKDRISIPKTTRDGETKTEEVGVAGLWLVSKKGRSHRNLVYAMPGSEARLGSNDYNGWLGFKVKPSPGSWELNKQHLQRIICAGNNLLFTWLINWMAALVQWPGRHAFTAVVLRGGQGIGKGHFAHQMLGALFLAQQYLHILGAGMLTGRFNEHLSGKVLIYADESTWGGDPLAADKLKGMVTENTIPIERKFLPLVEEPSALHIVIASNNEWPIQIPLDDRRFVVFDCADTERQNDEYFEPLREELKAGGLAAMLHDLLAHPIDKHALRHPPTTKGKREVMLQSLKPIERWWFEKLLRGEMAINYLKDDEIVTMQGWPTAIEKAVLHDDYLKFLSKHHDTRTRRSTETELGMFLKRYATPQTQRELFKSESQYSWKLPTVKQCRDTWAKACGWPADFDWEAEREG